MVDSTKTCVNVGWATPRTDRTEVNARHIKLHLCGKDVQFNSADKVLLEQYRRIIGAWIKANGGRSILMRDGSLQPSERTGYTERGRRYIEHESRREVRRVGDDGRESTHGSILLIDSDNNQLWDQITFMEPAKSNKNPPLHLNLSFYLLAPCDQYPAECRRLEQAIAALLK